MKDTELTLQQTLAALPASRRCDALLSHPTFMRICVRTAQKKVNEGQLLSHQADDLVSEVAMKVLRFCRTTTVDPAGAKWLILKFASQAAADLARGRKRNHRRELGARAAAIEAMPEGSTTLERQLAADEAVAELRYEANHREVVVAELPAGASVASSEDECLTMFQSAIVDAAVALCGNEGDDLEAVIARMGRRKNGPKERMAVAATYVGMQAGVAMSAGDVDAARTADNVCAAYLAGELPVSLSAIVELGFRGMSEVSAMAEMRRVAALDGDQAATELLHRLPINRPEMATAAA